MSALFAATYPELVSHLVLCGGFVRSADRALPEEFEQRIANTVAAWGRGVMIRTVSSAQAANPEAVAQFGKLERLSASPGAVKAIMLLNTQIDVTSILPSVRVPTLVLHRRTDLQVPVAAGAKLAAAIPGARFVEYPDGDHAFWAGDAAPMLGDIEEFLTGQREGGAGELERVLATVLFTDIVDSTRRATELGDQKWRGVLDSHDQLAKQTVERHRGTLVKTTGDGILATFDGPGRAVRCALAFAQAAGQLGIALRAGLHTGEIEMRGHDIGGIAVHAAARVMAQAQPGETLVSRVVTDLVAGAGLGFAERGSHELKGIPGRWELFAARL
jgi:class 3 adenylate cyclase